MSNYQEGSGVHGEGVPAGGAPYQEPAPAASAYQGAPQGGTSQFETPQYTQGSGGQSHWQTQPGHQGQGQQSHGMFHPGSSQGSRGRTLHVRSTFKTTEFWVLVVGVLALLIAAGFSDDQGLGAPEAWRYATWLAIAYILSRGLTKFSENDEDYDDDNRRNY